MDKKTRIKVTYTKDGIEKSFTGAFEGSAIEAILNARKFVTTYVRPLQILSASVASDT